MPSLLPTKLVNQELDALCAAQGVRCLFAVESGSRAWGFASTDSDYDIRFVYVRPLNDYLLLDRLRDVIEVFGDHDLDMVGWDLAKALKLLGASNPAIIEWLQTPEVYQKDAASWDQLREVARQCFSQQKLALHYVSVAIRHEQKYIVNEHTITPKRYLYALRAIFSAAYVLKHNQPAPIIFDELLKVSTIEPTLRDTIANLLEAKSRTKEKQPANVVPVLDSFIHEQIDSLGKAAKALPSRSAQANSALLDEAFRALLKD